MDRTEESHWVDLLSKAQQEQLRWLQDHRCLVEATHAPADPLHDLPPGFVLEVLVNKHGVVKIRSTDLAQAFDYVFAAAKNLFEFVEAYDSTWRGVESTTDSEAKRKK
ncbi:hypothetical protein [Deinococcus peraridilitoris]|uniref:Uncharacterized protein n=1 Tax=Deinococcus peraridilitoris (strain DSM 19664 / LMG 22246 / CIP 109416 / KR-200) TaxID=937777 RepID=L0A121_DEIPD|nr:hypothetical protein [Deinococcus peraridilitoris]AFZ66700.1 hypothetical protein Deipe_1141 [Deinococcus peraridilitoris DSM 19664]